MKNDVVKKAVYHQLVAKVNDIDTNDFVLKTKYRVDKAKLDTKSPGSSGLVRKPDYNTKLTELESKIPDVSSLATETSLTAVENKKPMVSSLVKKTDYDIKIPEIEKKLKINAS